MTAETKSRSCGECTACCKVFEIKLLNKRRGAWCTHCSIGRGCTIYETRPVPCQTYRCRWLQGHGSEDERPDKTRIVLGLMQDLDGAYSVLRMTEVREGALRGVFALKETARALGAGLVVWREPLVGSQTVLVRKGYPVPKIARQLEAEGLEIFQLTVVPG